MASCITCDYVNKMSNLIWTDINSPSDLAPSAITMKLTSDPFVGQINVLLNTCFAFVSSSGSGCFAPDLDMTTQGIFVQYYEAQYFQRKAIDSQGAVGALAWVEITEGDSTIRRASPNEIAKFYKDLYASAKKDLDTLVDLYRRNLSVPVSVDYITIDQYRSQNLGNYGYRSGP